MTTENKPVVSVTGLNKSYGDTVVLRNISFTIHAGEKIGLVGPNGSGKSTLLKILSKGLPVSSGTINYSKDFSVISLPQAFDSYSSQTPRKIIEKTVAEEKRTDAKIRTVFGKLRLNRSLLNRKMRHLSGGEKVKIFLSCALLQDAQFYILDEPTNNLDLPALIMLEEFIMKSKKTFLIVSHDREFLDKTVKKIFELDEYEHELTIYDGNFSQYHILREQLIQKKWQEYTDSLEMKNKLKRSMHQKLEWMENLEHLRKHNRVMDAHVQVPDDNWLRTKEGHMGRRARVMRDKLKKFIEEKEVAKPNESLPLKISFVPDARSGNKVFILKQVYKTLPDHILGPIDLDVHYGDRILIVGENGVGKSTLLKLLIGSEGPSKGIVERGTHLSIGYLPQSETPMSSHTVLQEFLSQADMDEGIARRLLNRYKLSAVDVHKKIRDLSSGERSRLILALLMARKVNCIILDEPSNHLDLEALGSLEEALRQFKGTVIVVSHDRYFIKKIGLHTIYHLKNQGLQQIPEHSWYEKLILKE